MKLFDDEDEEQHLWKVRESGLGATARIPGEKDAWEGWEDSAVPPERVGPYLRDLRKLFQKYGYNCALYGHFGQGCIHTRIDFELKTAEGVEHFRAFLNEAADLVVSHGGSISGEHGDGQSKAALLPKMFGPELVEAFREFKAIWDPDNKMNPHKVVDPYLPGENLRLGPHYHPPQVATHFKFPDDHGSFSYATERCVGVGECRKEESGTMCPSYMVTKEEMHSTRGRAHLLFEMLQRRPDEGALEGRAGPRGARPLPGVQGVPHRVPDERRHGHVQGRVPLALLRGPAPAAARLRDGPDLLVGPARLAGAGGRQPDHPRAGRRQALPDAGGHLDEAEDAVVRPRDVQAVVAAPAAPERGQAPGDPLARHLQQPLPPADRQGGRRGPGARRLPGDRPGGVALLRPAALRLRHARDRQGPAPRDPRHPPPGDRGGHPARRPRAELRRRLPRRADEPLPDGRGRQAAHRADLHPERVPGEEGARLPASRSSTARRSSTATATTSTS